MCKDIKKRFVASIFKFKRESTRFPPTFGINMGEFFMLDVIYKGSDKGPDGIDVSAIHKLHNTSKSAVSQSLKSLEKKNYIVREINLSDRRKVTVKVTEEGMRVIEDVNNYFDKYLDEIIKRFGIENTTQFINLVEELQAISHSVKKERLETSKQEELS